VEHGQREDPRHGPPRPLHGAPAPGQRGVADVDVALDGQRQRQPDGGRVEDLKEEGSLQSCVGRVICGISPASRRTNAINLRVGEEELDGKRSAKEHINRRWLAFIHSFVIHRPISVERGDFSAAHLGHGLQHGFVGVAGLLVVDGVVVAQGVNVKIPGEGGGGETVSRRGRASSFSPREAFFFFFFFFYAHKFSPGGEKKDAKCGSEKKRGLNETKISLQHLKSAQPEPISASSGGAKNGAVSA